MRSLILYATALLAWSTAACDDAEAHQAPCELGEGRVVGTTDQRMYDGIDVALIGNERALAVWSEPRGTFERELSPDGAASSEARRTGPRFEGGIAVARRDDTNGSNELLLAGLSHRREATNKAGGVTLWVRAGDGTTRARHRIGDAGDASDGISLATLGADRVALAWHDRSRGPGRIWTAIVNLETGQTTPPQVVSRPGIDASGPHVVARGEQWHVTWAETAFDAGGAPVSEVRVKGPRGAASTIATTLTTSPAPRLLTDDGRWVVAFRDERPAGSRPGIYLQRLSDGLTPAGEAVRVGRADGEEGPRLLSCEGDIYALNPHRYGTHDHLIAVHRYDHSLERQCEERQLYEVGTQFARASAVCLGGSVLLVAAEQGRSEAPNARVWSIRLVP